MVSLIALISSGKGSWGQVNSLISSGKWDKVYLLCNSFAYEKFEIDPQKAIKLKIDFDKIQFSYKKLSEFFKKEINDFEVALNLYSGTGLEHMCVISSLLKAGLGIRFVYLEDKEVKEFEILEENYNLEEENPDGL